MAGPKPLMNAAGEAKLPRAAKTAAQMAIPNTAPSCRSILRVPEAGPMAAGGTVVMTALMVAGMASDTPLPVMTSGPISSA